MSERRTLHNFCRCGRFSERGVLQNPGTRPKKSAKVHLDEPRALKPVNSFTGAEVARRVAEASLVLLKNADGLLPLNSAGGSSLAVIDSHADAVVLSGSGSDEVDAAGGNAVAGGPGIWHASSPLKETVRIEGESAKADLSQAKPAACQPAERAWQWYNSQPWLIGFNYIPATAIKEIAPNALGSFSRGGWEAWDDPSRGRGAEPGTAGDGL